MDPKQLLIVAHAPSDNTRAMRDAVLAGAQVPEIQGVAVTLKAPLQAGPDDVLRADAIVLGTTENLGYMSGALKDFFDRVYYPCLEEKQGLPDALYIRAGHDGTGTRRGDHRHRPALACGQPAAGLPRRLVRRLRRPVRGAGNTDGGRPGGGCVLRASRHA